MVYRLEVSLKVSDTTVRAGWKSAAPGQLDSAPEGGEVYLLSFLAILILTCPYPVRLA